MNSTERKRNSLANTAARIGGRRQLQSEINQLAETDVSKLESEDKDRIIYLSDSDLLDDPENNELYGPSDVAALSETIKLYGFQGVILAYPYEGKYRIESGHKRREAGRMAGVTRFPVYPTQPPKNDFERSQRLIMANLHYRKDKPTTVGKIAQKLFEIHQQETQINKAAGFITGTPPRANELVAMDLEMDISSVEKYRRLLKLVPSLQELADSGWCPWAELSTASALTDERQEALQKIIMERYRREGEDSVTQKWLHIQIEAQKRVMEGEAPYAYAARAQRSGRRPDAAKAVRKGIAAIKEAIELDTVAKSEIPSMIRDLEDLKQEIDQKIVKLKEQN